MPLSDVSISIGTVASQVFLSDQLCHVALILQILKAGNVSYQLYPLLMHYESCIRWWHTQTNMKIRELTLREKQAIWILKEKRKLKQKQRAWRNQEFGNHQRHQQPTTTGSAEKTTVVDDRQIIKTVKMNPKRSVCKITNNFQKAGWFSDNLLSSGDFDTELQTLHGKMQTSDQHQK